MPYVFPSTTRLPHTNTTQALDQLDSVLVIELLLKIRLLLDLFALVVLVLLVSLSKL